MKVSKLAVLACAPAVLLLSSIVAIKTNVPVLDDYGAVLGFLSSWSSGGDRSALLFERHNEHLIYFTRLVVLADYYVFGKVNFIRLSIYAATGLTFIYAAIRRIALREWGISSVVATVLPALVVFMPEHWKHLLYPMANIAAIWVVAFGLWFLAMASAKRHVLAMMLGIAALATSSVALLLPAAACAAMLVSRRYREAILYGLSFPLMVVAYSALSGESPGLLGNLLAHPKDCLTFAVGVLGSSVSSLLFPSVLVGIGTGVLLLAGMLTVIVTASRSTEPKPMTIGLSLFVLGGTFVIGLGRGVLYADHFDVSADGRYRIYSIVAVCVLLLAISRVRRPSSALALAVAMLALSYARNLSEWIWNARNSQNLVRTYLETRNEDVLPPRRQAPESLDAAIRIGVYNPP